MVDAIRWCFKHQERASWDYAENDDAEICIFGDEVAEGTGVKQGQRWYDCDVSDMKPTRLDALGKDKDIQRCSQPLKEVIITGITHWECECGRRFSLKRMANNHSVDALGKDTR